MPLSREQLLWQLAAREQRYAALEEQLAAQAPYQTGTGQAGQAHADPKGYQQLAKELSGLRELVSLYRTYRRVEQDAQEAEALFHAQGDLEIRELAKDEAYKLRQQQVDLLAELQRLWGDAHATPDRPLIVEIRAGTGGLEASVFAADLYRMYTKYAARCGLTVESLQSQPSEAGGLKEVSFAVRGASAVQRFQYESGVHRVQRIPTTEAQGRIHTSTATVAVLVEPEEVELAAIPPKDLQIDVYRASGPGGQGVNTTDSAVRIRHIPTGLVVTCQDERSQRQNKEKALRVLRARLLDQMQQSQQAALASTRRKQVGTGERSEKIRTYNFPDRRVTDHRAGVTLHKLERVMEGELDELVDAVAKAAAGSGQGAG